jgi:signal peptidase I
MKAEAMKPYESSYTPPRSRKSPLLWALIGVAGFIAVVIAIALAWLGSVARPLKIEGLSMSPTLNHEDRVLMLKQVGELHRGDIVVFLYPEDQTKSYISRIVGLPGETIDLRQVLVSLCQGRTVVVVWILAFPSPFMRRTD